MMSPVLIGVLVYVVVQLAIGLRVARGIQNEADYLVAGRSLGMGLAVFSLFATWFGAETCLGSAGATYAEGLSGGRADPFGYTLCLALMGLVFAVPLRRTGALTLGDAFRARFSPGAESLVVLFLVPASLLWAAAQIRALGQVLAALGGFDPWLTTSLAALVVILYTFQGGMRADVVTDLVQGIALALGLTVLLGAVMMANGGAAGFAGLWRTALSAEAARPSGPSWAGLEAWLVPIVGSVTAQELASRVLACRSPALARRATLTAATLYLGIGLIPVFLGLAGAGLVPGLSDPERILPELASRYLNPLGQVLLLGALVSAILSTVDSNLLSAAALVQHNVVGRLRPDLPDPARLAATRGMVVASGIIAWFLAVSRDSVYGLVEEASAFGGGGMAVAMTFGLLGRFGGPRAAVAAMATSLGVQVVGAYVIKLDAPMTLSCLVSLGVFVGVAILERRRS